MPVRVKVIKNRLPEIPAELRASVIEVLDVTMVETVNVAKQMAPVLAQATPEREPGTLRDSIKKRRRGLRGVVYTDDVFYAKFQEYGTVHNRAVGFMHKAGARAERVFAARVARALSSRQW